MTDILVRWLNEELNISRPVDQASFANEFASGFLIGEVLNKYQLQNDFDQFSQTRTNDAKLNNFTRLEPVFHLLGIPFDTNIARDIMTEKHGVATRIMYQLYIALSNKKKANLTGVAMETMRPAAPAKLNNIESVMYKERLKRLIPRQTDLNIQSVISRFHDRQTEMEKIAFKERFLEAEKLLQKRQENRQKLLERSRLMQQQQSELVAKIQAATVNIPKPPPSKTAKAIQLKKELRKSLEAKEMLNAINAFEEKMKMLLPPSQLDEDSGEVIDIQYIQTRDEDRAIYEKADLIRPKSNDEYINKIRKRLMEDASAREEREKRRRKVLVDQMIAHQDQEEAHREEMMVNRLMRQSQQERRIAVQLLQARHEKDIIRNNRIFYEKQYEERRLQDFLDALDREAGLARLAKIEYMEQILKDKELHGKIASEKAEQRYQRHYSTCEQIVGQIVEFACKVAEYRELTNNLLPPKLLREWIALFVSGKSLYDIPYVESIEMTPEQLLEEERQQLLDEGDFAEYKNMVGEWQPPETSSIKGPPRNNPIVGYIVHRLFKMVHPPTPPSTKPVFPPFPIKACILGKVFSGKSSCIQQLLAEHRLQVLVADILIHEAVTACENHEVVEPPEAAKALLTNQPEINVEADTAKEPASQTVAGTAGSGDRESIGSRDNTVTSADLVQANATATSARGLKKAKVSIGDAKSSARARLGARALKCLKKGKPVDDQIIVDILIETIRQIPEGTGWIIDGFPQTYAQAKLLEKALSGFDAAGKEIINKPSKDRSVWKSNLAPDPRPPPLPPDPVSGIDVVIVFDIDDSLCIKRAAGRYYAIQADESYHQEFKPPPEGSATGVGKQEQVIPVQDAAHDQEQIQHRLTHFNDSWPKLEKWFTRFGMLKHVDASQNEEAVFLETENILEAILNKLQGSAEQPTDSVATTEPKPEEKTEEKAPEPVPVPVEIPIQPPVSEMEKAEDSKGKASAKGKEKDKDKEKRDKSAGSKKSASEKSSESKGGKKGKGGKKAKTPEPEPEPPLPEEPPQPPPPEPGSAEWEFVDLPINIEIAQILSTHWETVEKAYVENSKHVFRNIRTERDNIYRYFYEIRTDFLAYLRRPDHKQEFVTAWQKDYNSVPDDMRDDEETRAELHQRVDDLRERLWTICDERKEQAEKERENIMNAGWLDDHIGILSNHYVTLLQAEVDRFQDTMRLLKDYYRALEGQIPEDFGNQYARLPLLELKNDGIPLKMPEIQFKYLLPSDGPQSTDTELTHSDVANATSGDDPSKTDPSKSSKDGKTPPKSPKDRSKSPKDKEQPRNASGKKGKGEKEPQDIYRKKEPWELVTRTKIPLIARRSFSPDADSKSGTAKAKDVKGRGGGKKGIVEDAFWPESPAPPTDLDEKLLYEVAQTGLNTILQMIITETAAKEAEEEADKLGDAGKKKEEEGKKGSGKKGAAASNKSPSPKKGKGGKSSETTPVPQPEPQVPESEEEKQKKLLKKKIKDEYLFALHEEGMAFHTRTELIRYLGIAILQDLRDKAENAFKDLNDWLGARFLKEMESIDQLSEVMRNAIENRQKIEYELALSQEDFLVNEDVVILKPVQEVPPPSPVETPVPDQFTVKQLLHLYHQFAEIAPSGIMSNKSFSETFENSVALTHGTEQFPDLWMNITPGQIHEVEQSLSAGGEYVDWHRLLVALTDPIPVPTQTDLLNTLALFTEMDQKKTGTITREQYDRMDLWFTIESLPLNVYNRVANLKKSFFDIFADHSKDPPALDYVSMLMYFSAAPNPLRGFLRALSVAAGMHMPNLDKPLGTIPTNFQGSKSFDDALPEVGDYEIKTKVTSSDSAAIVEDIPPEAMNSIVHLDALYRVLHHGEGTQGDTHRFSKIAAPEEATSWNRLAAAYVELGSENLEPLPYRILVEHPLIQDVITSCKTFQAVDIKGIFSLPAPDNVDIHSMKTD